MSIRYQKSEELLERAETVIPLGSQTFSKSKNLFPKNVSPFFAKSAKGCILTDVDDNKYIDWTMGLCSVLIGYSDSRINKAVKKQLKKGSIYGISSALESEVAEKIIDLIPNAEMVRFGKNGSDVTTGAIRLARYYTGENYIIKFKGHYHGWQSWTIAHVNNLGIPTEESSLTLLAEYNNFESVKQLFNQYPHQIAAVIMESMNHEFPKNDFLIKVQNLARQNGALFILDEVISGFRFARSGAQNVFRIRPDLICLGKGLANGFPLSALVGKREIMTYLQKVHFSFTFGGDCIALAAASKTLDILKDADYSDFFMNGYYLKENVKELLIKHNLHQRIEIVGFPTWTIFKFKNPELKALFFQEVFKRGILTNGSHNLSFSHNIKHIDQTLSVYDEVFSQISQIPDEKIDSYLNCEIVKPAYKVR
jgi:glutamate-1-semialdehyde 2,1-aminomutase